MSVPVERLLLIDLGNSCCKIAAVDSADTAVNARVNAEPDIGPGTIVRVYHTGQSLVITQALSRFAKPDRVLLSAVAEPLLAQELTRWCESHWAVEVTRFATEARTGELRNGYTRPEQLGVDRWLAMLAAWYGYESAVCVVDIGTATTLDWVDRKGQHLGGWIVPGPETMFDALNSRTAALPFASGEADGLGFATDTQSGIRRGVIAAQIGTIHQFHGLLGSAKRKKSQLVITGGARHDILPALGLSYREDDWLVMRGMLMRYRLNQEIE